jgi:signal transduction histidine kinase/DNA-binding response OmpR family regulator
VYEALGRPAEALQHYKAFYQLDTMIANRSDRQQLMRFEAKFQNEQQALEIARQKSRQRFLMVLLAGLLLLVLIVIAAYITQRKARAKLARQNAIIEQQAAELKELDIAKSRLFANISHELRTPLTLMLGPASSLAKRLPPDSSEQSFLDMIKANGEQLLRRVNEILDLSKLDAGQLEVTEEAVQVPDVLRRQIGLFESYAYQQGIALKYEDRLPAGLSLAADEDKLCKIVGNLLSNAIKFTPPDGSVELLSERRGESLAIEVSDSGRGIPPKDLAHIFERFYQSKHTQTPLEGGTGIGLAFCKELANALGGDIEARSTLGTGSTFTLLLPYREMQAPAEAEVSTQEVQPGAAEGSQPITLQQSPTEDKKQRGRILVVEDNIELQRYIAHVLAPYHSVQGAANGQEALHWLQDNGPDAVDLILSDVMMPAMDGFTLLQRVKADEQLKRLPVIMLTALAQQESRLKALRIGVDDYLLKPFQEEELLARVDSLLKNYRIRTAASKEEADLSNAKAAGQLAKEENANFVSEDRQDAGEEWLQQLEAKTLSHISNTNFTMDDLAEEMHMSRRQFYRAVKANTGLTPNQYTLEVRFQQARQLLEQKRFSNVKRVAYEVGFKDTRYFSQQYKKRFGRLPSGYL